MQNTSNTSASLDASALFGMQKQPPEPETIPEYPVSYEQSDQQDSGFTEYDFYEASRAWKRNKKTIGNGMYMYRSKANQIMWCLDSDSD